MLPGIHLTLLMGPTLPVPAPPPLTEALESVQVTHKDEGRSGFQLVFRLGRSGPADLLDYPLAMLPQLRPFSRVVLVVTFNLGPRVLMDGVISNRQFTPGDAPGGARLTVTGEDLSMLMDLEKKRVEHPAMDETLIALRLIGAYVRYGIVPLVIPPPTPDLPLPTERIPVQQDTDLAHLKKMAGRHGYQFHLTPGPAPLSSVAYWGPPKRSGIPQRALSVNMGSQSNARGLSFQYNALAPTVVSDSVQDSLTGTRLPVRTFFSTRPPLSAQPALPFNLPNVKTTLLEGQSGLSYPQALARAQGVTDKSMDQVVSVSGELDAVRYGGILEPRGLVGLRGAGFTEDGLYYVKSVTHTIGDGRYQQKFNLTRDGVGSLTPMVVP
jgi:hypothetical protein